MHRSDRLHVLTKADLLALAVYRLSARFPDVERFELRSQVRRAVVSVGSNIVEGAALGTRAGFARHLRIARGSAAEVDYQMRLAAKIGYISEPDYSSIAEMSEEVRKMLSGLIAAQRPDADEQTHA